jgi:hypothetical protein
MPTPSHRRRKRVPKPDRRRALELLASSPDGCTEGLMVANGFTIELLLEAVRTGLVSAHAERRVVDRKMTEVARMGITNEGRRLPGSDAVTTRRGLSKRRAMMKRALTGIASVGILAVTVGAETANAQSYRRYRPAQPYISQAYTPQSRGSVRREGVPRTAPFSDPNSPEATGGGSLGYNRTVPHW